MQTTIEGEGHGVGLGGSRRRAPHVLTTVEQVEQAVALYKDRSNFAFDVETTLEGPHRNELRWVGIGAEGMVHLIPCRHPKGVMIQPKHKEKMAACLFYPEGDPRALTKLGKPSWRMVEYPVEATYAAPPEQLYPHEVMELLRPIMFSDKGKVGHNVKFDLMTVAKYYGGEIPPGPYHDTILMTHVLDEDKLSYDLKTLTKRWYEDRPGEKVKLDYPNMGSKGTDNFGLDEVARYLAKDVRYCWLRFQNLMPKIDRKGLRTVYDFEMSVYPSVMAMQSAGFPVDLSQLEKVRTALEKEIGEIEEAAHLLAGDQFPLSNLEAKRWVLFGEGKAVRGAHGLVLATEELAVRTRTKVTDVPQVTAQVLEYYADKGNDVAQLLSDWAKLEKLRGTFIEGIHGFLNPHPGALPTIHGSLKQHGTVTGRFSSSEPNLQQLPREQKGRTSIRSLFVAGPGRHLIVADYDQVELRVAGFLSGDPEMMRVFQAGEDIHASAAAAMFRLPLEEVTQEQRGVGKTQNFAVLYGAGPDKVAVVAGCSIKKAEVLIKSYFATFSQLEPWKYRELQRARKLGDRQNPWSDPPRVVIPPFGRLRRLPMLFELKKDYVRYHAERQAINALCQGFAAYVTKIAMVELHESLPAGAEMIAQVHDEIIVIADDDVVEEAEMITRKVMEGVINPMNGKPILGAVPLVVSAATGNSWAEAKG